MIEWLVDKLLLSVNDGIYVSLDSRLILNVLTFLRNSESLASSTLSHDR